MVCRTLYRDRCFLICIKRNINADTYAIVFHQTMRNVLKKNLKKQKKIKDFKLLSEKQKWIRCWRPLGASSGAPHFCFFFLCFFFSLTKKKKRNVKKKKVIVVPYPFSIASQKEKKLKGKKRKEKKNKSGFWAGDSQSRAHLCCLCSQPEAAVLSPSPALPSSILPFLKTVDVYIYTSCSPKLHIRVCTLGEEKKYMYIYKSPRKYWDSQGFSRILRDS